MATFTQSPTDQTTLALSVDTVGVVLGANENELTWVETFFTWSQESGSGGSVTIPFYMSNSPTISYVAPSLPTTGQVWPVGWPWQYIDGLLYWESWTEQNYYSFKVDYSPDWWAS